MIFERLYYRSAGVPPKKSDLHGSFLPRKKRETENYRYWPRMDALGKWPWHLKTWVATNFEWKLTRFS